MILSIILATALCVCASALFYSVQSNLAHAEKIDELQEAIQASLDILVEQHEVILEKSKIEIFSDEPVVKELVRDIAIARDSVLIVAKILDDSIATEEN